MKASIDRFFSSFLLKRSEMLSTLSFLCAYFSHRRSWKIHSGQEEVREVNWQWSTAHIFNATYIIWGLFVSLFCLILSSFSTLNSSWLSSSSSFSSLCVIRADFKHHFWIIKTTSAVYFSGCLFFLCAYACNYGQWKARFIDYHAKY